VNIITFVDEFKAPEWVLKWLAADILTVKIPLTR
jgi:hypothetical protein